MSEYNNERDHRDLRSSLIHPQKHLAISRRAPYTTKVTGLLPSLKAKTIPPRPDDSGCPLSARIVSKFSAVVGIGFFFQPSAGFSCVVSIRVCASPPHKRARTDPAAFPSGLLLAHCQQRTKLEVLFIRISHISNLTFQISNLGSRISNVISARGPRPPVGRAGC